MSRRRAPGAADDVAHKQPKLPHVSNVTKSALVRTLLRLQETGLLLTDASGRQLRRQANNTDIDQIETPYGKLLQCMYCGASRYVDVAHPAALLFHLSSISVAFANAMMVMADAAGSDPLKLIIYSDGLTPGNVFRPDAGRKLLAIYWTLVEFPDHMRWRSACWPVFALIRVSIVAAIAAGSSGLMRRVLRFFLAAFA